MFIYISVYRHQVLYIIIRAQYRNTKPELHHNSLILSVWSADMVFPFISFSTAVLLLFLVQNSICGHYPHSGQFDRHTARGSSSAPANGFSYSNQQIMRNPVQTFDRNIARGSSPATNGFVQGSNQRPVQKVIGVMRASSPVQGSYPQQTVQKPSSNRLVPVHPLKLSSTTCPDLKSPANGYVVATGIHHGAIAKYYCQYGHKLTAPSVRYCFYGSWTGETPSCSKTFSITHAIMQNSVKQQRDYFVYRILYDKMKPSL